MGCVEAERCEKTGKLKVKKEGNPIAKLTLCLSPGREESTGAEGLGDPPAPLTTRCVTGQINHHFTKPLNNACLVRPQ